MVLNLMKYEIIKLPQSLKTFIIKIMEQKFFSILCRVSISDSRLSNQLLKLYRTLTLKQAQH